MGKSKVFNSLGLMSGTSADGIDIALIQTDGKKKIKLKRFESYKFSSQFRNKIKKSFKKEFNKKDLGSNKITALEREFTDLNYKFINKFIRSNKIRKNSIDVVGFHGQTISHNPKKGYSIQLGDAKRLANLLKIKVISNFRSNDISLSGEGAPLTPIFHYFLTNKIKKRICFVNLGGIINLTYLNHRIKNSLNNMLAFDTGPCCSLLDDWINFKINKNIDDEGKYSSQGKVNIEVIKSYFKNNFFSKKPPKSLDRSFFSIKNITKNTSLKDGAATLCSFSSDTLADSLKFLPDKPEIIILSGGGRKNKFLVKQIKKKIDCSVHLSDNFNWNGDSIEAFAFGFLEEF